MPVDAIGDRMLAELETLPPHYLTQCHRCQEYGHTHATCRRQFICMKCARPHRTTTCTKTRAEPSRCHNCGGRHVALYKGCPEYQRRKRWAEHHQSMMAEREMAGTGGRRASRPHSPQELVNAPQKPIQAAIEPTQPVQEPTQADKEPIQAAIEPAQPAQEPTQAAQEPPPLLSAAADASSGPIQAAKEPIQAAIEPTQPAQEPTQADKEPIQVATEPAQPAQEPTQAAQEPPPMPSASADASSGSARPDKKTLCQQVIERLRGISANANLPKTDGPNRDEFPSDIMFRLNTAYATLGALLECFDTFISIGKMDIPDEPADDNK